MDLIGIYFAQNDQKSEILTQMIWYIDISVNCIIWNRDFSSKGHIPDTPRATSKNSELWIIFWSSPRFLAILGLSQFAGVSTLSFGQWSLVNVTCWDRPGHQKWPTMTTDLVPAVQTEERKWFLSKSPVFPQKHLENLLKGRYLIGKGPCNKTKIAKPSKVDPKNVSSQKSPQNFELLEQVPESPHQTGSFGQNQYIGTLILS